MSRRDELVKRIASNKGWLSKNWHHGKDVRRGCQANIEADERELAKLDAQAEDTTVKERSVSTPPTPPPTPPTKPATPEVLAHEIYDQAIQEARGDEREASVTVMRFLTEALVYSAGVSTGGDEVALKGMLKHLGKMIAEAPVHPIVAAVAAARDAKKREPKGP